ncbi:MAG TPA: serpin family protein [Candidatus Krumholzibacteria bacterium]|nr:serpin family protein [Candidatus Krumholzibacteria bacterium]
MTVRGVICGFLIAGALALLACPASHASEGDPAVAAGFINALGIDLLSSVPPDGNAVLSPYSIQCALAMTWAGADGDTRAEMARVLHYPADESETHASLAALTKALNDIAAETERLAAERGGDPITFVVANRLFGQTDYPFRTSFTEFIKSQYEAPLQLMDFARNADGVRGEINAWVEEQTRQKIRDLIPPGELKASTRLVLVNAIYLKAQWLRPFPASWTQPNPFHTADGDVVTVPTMRLESDFGFVKREDYAVVTMPYIGGGLQLLILLPDRADGLTALERKLTPEMLVASSTDAVSTDVLLEFPKFKVEPPVMRLGSALQSLGMKTAFDGRANFGRMASGPALFIGAVFHQTFLAVDEQGTEAAGATALAVQSLSEQSPVKVKVDRPFLLAIQHRATGACLFLGRITDPR